MTTQREKIEVVVAKLRAGKDPDTGELHIAESEAIAKIERLIIEGKIEEVNWLRNQWQEYMLPEDETLFDDHIETLQASLKGGGDE